MKLTHILAVVVLVCCSALRLEAQEVIGAPSIVKEKIQQYEAEQKFAPRSEKAVPTQTLPFIDDFSFYTLPTNDPDIPESWQKWLDDDVFINNTSCVNPPTVGVATFDGTANTGYPYNLSVVNSYGPADSLTSCPIDLDGLGVDDNVYLTFFVQAAGLANAPNTPDSLYLEFRIPGTDLWSWKWSIHGTNVASPFNQYFVKVDDPIFFSDEFQFRFSCFSTLSGAWDQWHLDYVYLDANINPETFELRDMSYCAPIQTFLSEFQSMPWTHYIDNPADHMIFQQNVVVKNLQQAANNLSIEYEVLYEDLVQFTGPNFTNTNFPAGDVQTINSLVGGNSPEAFAFDPTVADDCATFDVRYVLTAGVDDLLGNDTLQFQQEFSNYYAYDDGTAETDWALQFGAIELAVKFDVDQPDSLLGLFAYIMPYETNSEGEILILRVRDDNGGLPGEELVENFAFQEATIFEGTPNAFSYYAYDDPVPVDGTIHVGWVQSGNNEIHIGNDMNTPNNVNKLSFRAQVGGPWQQSSSPGSVMIRPVFTSGKGSDFVGVAERTSIEATVYPNPANDQLFVEGIPIETAQYDIYSATGQLVSTGKWQRGQALAVTDLPRGMYFLQLVGTKGEGYRSQWIKQ